MNLQQSQKISGTISLNGLFEDEELEATAFPKLAVGSPVTDLTPEGTESKKPHPSTKVSTTQDDSTTDSEQLSYAEILIGRELDTKVAGPATPDHSKKQVFREQQQVSAIEEKLDQERFTRSSKKGGRPLLWSVGILCLMAGALTQVIWFSRDNLKSYPEVRELLELVCVNIACELPPWHEPERFKITSRSVKTHPENSSALQIRLVFSNAARFAQPYPQLQLRLYNTDEKLSAQRVFQPQEYLAEPESGTPLIQPAQSVAVDMALEDPGIGITGFKIEFL